MKKFSKNKKLNYVLNDIYSYLLEMGKDEIKRYMNAFPDKMDYNIYEFGNMRVYNDEIIELYKNYKCLKNASIDKLIDIYIRQVGYMARIIVNE